MNNAFFYSLKEYIRDRDTDNAAQTVMQELGRLMVHDRDNFITLLKFASLPADDSMSDAELIKLFVDNSNNRKLLISAAFFINQNNKKVGFDGESEVSDAGVKAVHKVIYNYFDAYRPMEYSNAGGAWAGAIDTLGKLGGNIVANQRSKKNGVIDMLAKREETAQKQAQAQIAMAKAAAEQRRAQQAAAIKAKAEKDKRKKIFLWTGVGFGALVVTGTIIYFVRRK